MATKKKAAEEPEQPFQNVNAGAARVPIGDLTPHPRNVNEGDVGGIHQSMQTNGWFGRILVQKDTGLIIAGKHRWMAARDAGATEVDIEWLDVDDEQAIRIMLADNRLARLGYDDEAGLADVLSTLAATDRGLAGTGFDGDDLDHLLAMMQADDLADVAEEYDDTGFWPTVKVQVPPDVYERWQAWVKTRTDDEGDDDAEAFAALLDHAEEAAGG